MWNPKSLCKTKEQNVILHTNTNYIANPGYKSYRFTSEFLAGINVVLHHPSRLNTFTESKKARKHQRKLQKHPSPRKDEAYLE